MIRDGIKKTVVILEKELLEGKILLLQIIHPFLALLPLLG